MIAMPPPDQAVLARRAQIVTALRRIVPGGIVTLPCEERERTMRGTDFHAAATTSRHVLIAAARSTRCD